MLTSCVTSAYMYGLQTMALTQTKQVKVQICKNNWFIRELIGEEWTKCEWSWSEGTFQEGTCEHQIQIDQSSGQNGR